MFIWALIRRLLALLIRVLLLNRIVTLGVFALLIVGLVGYPLVSGRLAVTSGSSTAGGPATSAMPPVGSSEAPSAAVQNYLKGMATFDAKLMWSALSKESIDQMTTNGGSIEQLQQSLDDIRQSGARYEDVSYVGGYPLLDGSKYFFFVVSRRGFSAPNAVDQIFFVFTVGPDGRILRID